MQSKPELEVIVPEWNAPENIKAFFTLRSGGMSAGAYGDKDGFCGLNLGNHVGDNKYSVRGNRRIVTDMLGAEPKWLIQVHSSRVVRAEDNNAEEQADAEFATTAGIPCVVMTADCVPVLLCDKKGTVIAAAHAGWKGLADGVLQNTVAAMRKEIGDEAEIIAWIGPHIRKDHFEVRDDVADYYRASAVKAAADDALESIGEGVWHLDLARFAKEALKQAGVTEVTDCGRDTYSDPEHFYSYRRDKVTGRHGAFICKR